MAHVADRKYLNAPRETGPITLIVGLVLFMAPAIMLPMVHNMFGTDGMTQQYLIPANLKIGILFFVAISSYGIVAIIMAGYASHNKFSLLGAMRAAAQIISYDLPLALSVVPVIMI